MIVILDNGHGIRTRGKRSPVQSDTSQLFEFEFNRDIVRRIAEDLSRLRVQFHILVREIEDISLQERCQRANQIFAAYPSGEAFLISVHANAGGGNGLEFFTSPGETESDKIATIFCEQASREFPTKRIRSDYSDGDPDKEAAFYVLKYTTGPAVLTENFFMDSQNDLNLIMSEEGRKRIARYHVQAIVQYIESTYKVKAC